MLIAFNISNFFNRGHSRTVAAKKNVAGNILIKVFSMFISFIIVPITINYINPTQYGIWLTLTSMISWVALLDVGLTQGLRNKFAEAKAKNDDVLAKVFVSTTYFYITVLFVGVWLLFFIVNNFLDWSKIINIPVVLNYEVRMLASIIITYFCLQFIFQIIKTIIIADQKPAIASLIDLIGQVVSLLIIYIFTLVTNGSLVLLGIAIGVFPVIFLIIANVYFFSTDYKKFKPDFKFVKNEYRNELMGLGLKFFILQLAGMIQYGSSLFLIARYFNTSEVTSYNIAFKYFMTLQGVFFIFLAPLWSSSTDAYFKGDYEWIINIVKKYLFILIPFIGLGVIMLIFANQFYDFWLGKDLVEISYEVSLYSFIFFASGMFASIFVNVINGIGALRVQFYSSFITSIGFILLALFFIKYLNLPVWSIILASIISNVYGYILAPIQLYQILVVRKLNSIWFK